MTYNLTGKFMAPSDTWQHARFDLTDFELFVMTEGTLYISYAEENFQVSNGEYLLLPPKANAWRQGFQPAYCEFYWLHFSYEPSDKAQTSSLPSLPAFPGACQESVFSIPQQGKIPKPEKMVILMKQLQDSVKNNYPKLALNAMATCRSYRNYTASFTCTARKIRPSAPASRFIPTFWITSSCTFQKISR